MLGVKLICVGKLREKYFTDGVAEYAKRLSAYCKFEVCEIAEERFKNDNVARGVIDAALCKEGTEILKKIPERSRVVALCVEGKQMSTEDFAKYIENAAVDGVSSICFIIGSSYGLCDEVKKRADLKLSFSKMTFPHTLMRLIFSEQIYRAFKVLKGETYHK